MPSRENYIHTGIRPQLFIFKNIYNCSLYELTALLSRPAPFEIEQYPVLLGEIKNTGKCTYSYNVSMHNQSALDLGYLLLQSVIAGEGFELKTL